MTETLKFGYVGNIQTVWDKNRNNLLLAEANSDGTLVTFHESLTEIAKKMILREVSYTYRICHQKIPIGNLGRPAVVIYTEFEANKSYLGIQFWTPEMIDAGTAKNTDGTTAQYVGLYQQFKKRTGDSQVKLYDWENYFGDRFAVDSGSAQTDYFKTFSLAVDMFLKL
ncbi:MAG: hypothetical protein LBQ74_19935 [Prevotella sp.]|jgi:hypothetical protein|nr:hypothetical protein [Prevotella sp.]